MKLVEAYCCKQDEFKREWHCAYRENPHNVIAMLEAICGTVSDTFTATYDQVKLCYEEITNASNELKVNFEEERRYFKAILDELERKELNEIQFKVT